MRMRILCLLAILAATTTMTVTAQPAQRIIMGFETAITESAKSDLEAQVSSILERPLKLVAPSNEKRWVLELTPPLNPTELQSLMAKLKALDNVLYVEPDQLLQYHPVNPGTTPIK